jgi:hypothetical protein
MKKLLLLKSCQILFACRKGLYVFKHFYTLGCGCEDSGIIYTI